MSFGEILFNIAFYICAIVGVLLAIAVATSKNIIRTAYYLFLCLISIAGFYGFMQADLILAIQILIYVGGITVLIIFATMLTRKITDINVSNESIPSFAAGCIVFCILFSLVLSIIITPWPAGNNPIEPLTKTIGKKLVSDYLLPFEVASMLLLAAIIGAVFITRKEVKS